VKPSQHETNTKFDGSPTTIINRTYASLQKDDLTRIQPAANLKLMSR
jgi:hypothetical protein